MLPRKSQRVQFFVFILLVTARLHSREYTVVLNEASLPTFRRNSSSKSFHPINRQVGSVFLDNCLLRSEMLSLSGMCSFKAKINSSGGSYFSTSCRLIQTLSCRVGRWKKKKKLSSIKTEKSKHVFSTYGNKTEEIAKRQLQCLFRDFSAQKRSSAFCVHMLQIYETTQQCQLKSNILQVEELMEWNWLFSLKGLAIFSVFLIMKVLQ